MTYNPAIPGATDLISSSQSQIQTNFSQADTAFAIDHTAFSTVANQGQHKKVTLIAPIVDQDQVGNLSTVYSKTSGSGVELFYQHGTAGNGVSQLTGGGVTAAAYCTFNNAGTLTAGSFNVASTLRNAQGVFTVSFTRNFLNTNYIAIVSPNMQSVNGFAIKVSQETKNVGSFAFSLQDQTNTFRDPVTCDLVFFGVLA